MDDEPVKKVKKFNNFEDELEDKDILVPKKGIPTVILKVWGNINLSKYKMLKNNPTWMNLSTKVCDECYIELTRLTFESQYERNVKV